MWERKETNNMTEGLRDWVVRGRVQGGDSRNDFKVRHDGVTLIHSTPETRPYLNKTEY